MATTSPALPTNRTFITQLFDSLSRLPGDQAVVNDNANTNPLNGLPDATRKQLLTLQVLFPSEFVPALDLLDRRLVTRFYIRDEERRAGLKTVGAAEKQQDVRIQSAAETDAPPPPPPPQQQEDAHVEDGSTADKDMDTRTTPAVTTTTAPESEDNPTDFTNNTIYYVRSAQHHRPSRFTTSLETTTYYQVRLRSWNCTCPAFAFSAFPASIPNNHNTQKEEKTSIGGHVYNDTDKKWVFGGMTLGTATPPVCKHILACVFVERCRGLFVGFVEGREVSGEEAAGWGAGWGD